LLAIAEIIDFEPLIFNCLFVGRDPNVTVNHVFRRK
jgi:hypothetical protein